MEKILVLHMFREIEMGGIQIFLKNIYENIDRNQIQFDFLVNSKGELDDDFRKLGSNIYYIPNFKEVGPVKYKKELDNFFKQHKEYKIVHIHFDQFGGLIGEVARKNNIETIILHAHIVGNNTSILGKIYKRSLQGKIYRYITDYLACSTNAAQWLFKKKANQAKIVYNGIKINDFKYNDELRTKVRNSMNINKDTIVFGHVGRMTKEKNQKLVIDIFNEYYLSNSNSLLILVGDGNDFEDVKSYAKTKTCSKKIIFLGNRNDVNKLYNAFDILLFPSQFEGLGIALIEAQVNGITCFSSTNVPKETKISDNIYYISLKKTPREWTNIIKEKYKKTNRKEIFDKIHKDKYDIKVVSSDLLEFYKKKYDKSNI